MTLIQKIEAAQVEFEPVEAKLDGRVARTFKNSGLERFLNELKIGGLQIETEQTVLEAGKKLLIVAQWKGGANSDVYDQAVFSIRGNSISFIGNPTGQFIKLAGADRLNSELVENSLTQTIANPQKIQQA